MVLLPASQVPEQRSDDPGEQQSADLTATDNMTTNVLCIMYSCITSQAEFAHIVYNNKLKANTVVFFLRHL